ncbi:MAG TPA: site-specific tyrosine recombinase/integron integrase [Patescibacteria group bacterium]
MTIEQTIRRFLEHLEVEEGKSRLTLRNYEHYLATFLHFCDDEKIKEPNQITQNLVTLFRLWLNRPHKQVGKNDYLERSRKTQNYYLIALRSYLKYLSSRDIVSLPPEKITLAKTESAQITFLEPEEIERIIQQPEVAEFQGKRDRAILEMLFSTGLRISELTNLNRDDLQLETGEFSLRGKGGKVRVAFLSDDCIKYIKSYLKHRVDEDKALFIRTQSNQEDTHEVNPDLRLTPRSVQRLVQKYTTQAGIAKKVTPHVFRHSFATDLLQNGADLRSVQELLGHSSVTTTQIYTHITNPQLQEVHKAFHARRRNQTAPEEKSALHSENSGQSDESNA